MNLSARISNSLRHTDESSALCVGSHNCLECGEKSICPYGKSIPHCPSVITNKLTLTHPLVKS